MKKVRATNFHLLFFSVTDHVWSVRRVRARRKIEPLHRNPQQRQNGPKTVVTRLTDHRKEAKHRSAAELQKGA